MSQRTNLTIDAIAAAIADIEVNGKKATIAAIQGRVGGSMTTVNRLVREMRGETESAKTAEINATEEGVELPAGVARVLATLPTVFLAALAEVRAEERRSARAEIDSIRAEADKQAKEASERLESAQTEFEALAEQADRLEAELSAANEARKVVEIKASEAEARLAARDMQISDLVRQIADLASQIGKAEAKAPEVKAPRQKRPAPKKNEQEYPEAWARVAAAYAAGTLSAEDAVKKVKGSAGAARAVALLIGRPELAGSNKTGRPYKNLGELWEDLTSRGLEIARELNPANVAMAEREAREANRAAKEARRAARSSQVASGG